MDYLLPDDEAMRLMREEYAKLNADKRAAYAAAYLSSLPVEDDATNEDRRLSETTKKRDGNTNKSNRDSDAVWLLVLYFIGSLRYNSVYGTQIHDSHRGMGRVQSDKGTFRDLNNLV